MKIKKALYSVISVKYKDGFEDGVDSERNRIVKLVLDYGWKHNSHPYVVDIIKLIEFGEKK